MVSLWLAFHLICPNFACSYSINLAYNKILRNNDGTLQNPVSAEDWGMYQYRKNGTRRFLVDSNNLYISIRTGEGVALEPFKRAHRYVDVLKAFEGI